MARNHRVYRIVAAIVVGAIILSLSTSTGRDRKGYEVEAQVYGVPAAQSDASRAIDAYERVMERHMDMTERSLSDFTADLKVLATKFDAFDAKVTALDARLTQIDQRLARIEKHLGIAPLPPPAPAKTKADPNAPAGAKAPLSDSLPTR
ncbi:MAG: hypothetical protein ABFE01_01790 [Phycisphaerales bacterium]